jgi:gas vesicle structural protein
MSLKRAATETSLIDVLDRVLDKGIVIDAWVRVSLVGVDLLQVETRIVIASISTYLTHAGSLESNTIAPRLSREQSTLRIDRRRDQVTLRIQPRAA